MGAWGYGLLQNDQSLNSIDPFRVENTLKIKDGIDPNTVILKVRKDGSGSILGAAEFLAENNSLNQLEPSTFQIIFEAIKTELTRKKLNEWDSPEERRKVLIEFRNSLIQR